ncbi:histidine kinase [Streptomyces sp. WELS2]|uniref:sensor histidine kinase n=1 Tax=Streptomyces sp. WELS2 TaxID=2749435 RepID=UPI0015F01176|nr:histidine kinase [Streptomyces sp. WELS2]
MIVTVPAMGAAMVADAPLWGGHGILRGLVALLTVLMYAGLPALLVMDASACRPRRLCVPLALLPALAVTPLLVLMPDALSYPALALVVSLVALECRRQIRGMLWAQQRRIVEERKRTLREGRQLRRDVHDVLGYSLSAITVKAELVDRYLVQNDPRVREEVAELLALSRRTLAEMRSFSSAARRLSLGVELASVRRVLAAAGVETLVYGDASEVHDPALGAALSLVLREGATNILRHSKAGLCRITLSSEDGTVLLRLSNDGYRGEVDDGEPLGTGLASLSSRLTAFDGTLTWTHEGGWFHLTARAPQSVTSYETYAAT